LMSAKLCLSLDEFKRVLNAIIVVCFRYNVICDKNPNDQDAPFNALAIDIFNRKTADLTILDKIYIEDVEFERVFAEKSFAYNSRNAKVIRYILGKIDLYHGHPHAVNPTDDNASIEHILPLNFIAKWDIDEAKGNKMVDRLGNMCLLDRKLNRDIQDATYEEKLPVYAQSTYLSSKELEEKYGKKWDDSSISQRQVHMAKCAMSIWRKNF